MTFAKVLCLVLVAAPLTHTSESFAGRYAKEANKTITKIEKLYKIAKSYVDIIVSQIKLEPLHQRDFPFNPQSRLAKCYNFLNEYIRTNKSRVIECSAGSTEAASKQRDLVQKTFEDSVAAIRAHGCLWIINVSIYLSGALNAIRSTCQANFDSYMEAANNQAERAFFEFARNASKVLRNWVETAGHCVAISEKPSQEAHWRRVCQNG